jgi:hypothetical protein
MAVLGDLTLRQLSINGVVGDFCVKEDHCIYLIISWWGAGGEDNSSFEIIGNSLKVKSILTSKQNITKFAFKQWAIVEMF